MTLNMRKMKREKKNCSMFCPQENSE